MLQSLRASEGDGTLELIADIFSQLDVTEGAIESGQRVAGNVLKASEGVEECFFSFSSKQGTLWESASNFGLTAAAYTQDIEFLLKEDRLTVFLSGINLTPIEHIEDGQKLRLIPIGTPSVHWSHPQLPRPMQDCIFLKTMWDVEYRAFPSKRLVVLVSLSIVINTSMRKIGFSETNAPRFFDINGLSSDPFSMVPREEHLRTRLKERFYAEITDKIASLKSEVPIEANEDLPRPFAPHFYHVGQYALGLVGRTVSKRRSSYPIWRWPIVGNQAIRLKSDHIRPKIEEFVRNQGLDLNGLEFRSGHFSGPGFVELKVHYRQERSVFYIRVRVDVWLTYHITFPYDLPALLFTEALQTYWEYKVKAYNCWPICDKVIRKARRIVMEEIQGRELLTFPFKDFRGRAFHAQTQIDTFGVLIEMEVW